VSKPELPPGYHVIGVQEIPLRPLAVSVEELEALHRAALGVWAKATAKLIEPVCGNGPGCVFCQTEIPEPEADAPLVVPAPTEAQ
jgi:hypothetical protein